MCENTHCLYAITNIVDLNEGIEVILFCRRHDCLPEDTPSDCDTNKMIDEYTDAMLDALHQDLSPEADFMPYCMNCPKNNTCVISCYDEETGEASFKYNDLPF